ncbi:leucyl aminopeptidase family protein [Leucobacter massiliensis]|uniref:Probable cytosol aminopeptidase n=1 Tax=Leucobacter massiliensis TaxID=1686285 RepID=A0A2S9QP80_9MICO|nr:leucyl aminopeptidase [Leucobacter massiliensis]PRI11392.1 leucyl aminopeptidase [Leucobacter massiliensis]
MSVVIDPAFDPVPSLARSTRVSLTALPPVDDIATAVFVRSEGELPAELAEAGREALAAAGFTGAANQTLLLPGARLRVLVGTGERGIESDAQLRDAAAAFARAAREAGRLAIDLTGVLAEGDWDVEVAVQAAIEGAALARYRYDALKSDPKTVALEELSLQLDESQIEAAEIGVERGLVLARTAALARDLANTPPRHLSAVKFAEVIERLAPEFGLEAEVFDREALIELGTGGLLGVNAGSVEEPRMIKVTYRPEDADGFLALIGKGIMYDSGGISLKPSNAMHAAMKFDMMGAAAVFASMTALRDLGAKTAVTGWLMCTDNMPSGSATKLGDVLTIRGGKTVEVKNTDAEGRLVMADGLVLATEEERRPDAIVDIATLTGAAMMALGTRTAAMLANNDDVAAQLQAAADATDENIWRFPLDHRYRDQLKSTTADLSNIGGQYAGVILAALFLNEFVDGLPWGHLDIAGTMQAESDDLWRSTGSTGFGARLLAEFAAAFEKPAVEETDTVSGETDAAPGETGEA